ncbi:MAG: hypothetical protein GY737_30510 [Desulfobacteraceae bacterium]|nr:hypothetical protein [Desulfobacteraceae bacterium]
MSDRSATDTIKGYFYQFDYSIEKILSLSGDNDEITVEGVEDIDIETSTERTAIQCKYYSKSEYNHSVIAKPIRLMLSHFKEVKNGAKPQIKYHLYGHYKSGQDKLSLPVDVSFLKEKILTYTKAKTKIEEHNILGLSDEELQEFLDLLSIDINAKNYINQFDNILTLFMGIYSCDKFEAEYYYYNNALNEIRKVAIENDVENRKIKKSYFLNKINNRQVLFNKWFLELKGRKRYHKELKDQYFRTLNKSPFERFFLIDLPSSYSFSELKELIFIISKRYSNLKRREPQTYCPYIYFNNFVDADLIELKKQLYAEGFNFIDGVPFLGSDFSTKAISIKADCTNGIKIKILKNSMEISNTLNSISKTKKIYQFYFGKPFFINTDNGIANVRIQISKLDNIKEII